jgi:hypothetical protein
MVMGPSAMMENLEAVTNPINSTEKLGMLFRMILIYQHENTELLLEKGSENFKPFPS